MQISETLSVVPNEEQGQQMSADGLAAARVIALARVTLHDGDVDQAKQHLTRVQWLLSTVKTMDKPVTVATQVNRGEQAVHPKSVSRTQMFATHSVACVVDPGPLPASSGLIPGTGSFSFMCG